MVKQKHKSPMQYRVIYRINGSAVPNENYYNVFHSSEALVDLLHTLNKGSIGGNEIIIISIDEWCPYRNSWLDRTDKALDNTDAKHLFVNGENIKFNKYASTE